MKIETRPYKGFKPFELVVRFETREELQTFKEMMGKTEYYQPFGNIYTVLDKELTNG